MSPYKLVTEPEVSISIFVIVGLLLVAGGVLTVMAAASIFIGAALPVVLLGIIAARTLRSRARISREAHGA